MLSASLATNSTDGAVALSIPVRLVLAAVGAVPVSLIGAATFGVFSLRELAIAVLMPALGLLAILFVFIEPAHRLVGRALVAGLLATFIYDLLRWSFLIVGLMDRDPIPHIGLSLGLEPGWVFGYLWRFIGNGGGIAVAFYAFGGRGIVLGTAHGLVVCSGLLGVLIFSPNGQAVLFPLEPATLVVAVAGHIIYGAVLGLIAERLPSPAPLLRWPRRQKVA